MPASLVMDIYGVLMFNTLSCHCIAYCIVPLIPFVPLYFSIGTLCA